MTSSGPFRIVIADRFPMRCAREDAALTRGMEPVGVDRTHILILNYNGRELLA